MEEKNMHLTATVSAFVLAFLSQSGVQGQKSWSVTYSPSKICAIKGSTVELQCNYTYPSKTEDTVTEVKNLKWFTKGENTDPVDLKTDQDYVGRVEYKDGCTIEIRDVRETDSAVYKIRFITNHQHGKYTGLPGVHLFVSAFELHVIKSERRQNHTWTEMKCKSSCLPDQHPYTWIKNGKEILPGTSSSFSFTFSDTDHISCAAPGYEKFPSPSVYMPKLPSVSLGSSGEILEGSSITLICTSDANPAANYTWYKRNVPDPLGKDSQLVFKSVQSSDTGKYFCKADNMLKMITSEDISVDVE
ncbi:hypothetical protein AMECASPLE_019323, partial [Ameca splendens]